MSTVSTISNSRSFSVPNPNKTNFWNRNLGKYAFQVQKFGEGDNMTFTIKFYRLPVGNESNLLATLNNKTTGITLNQDNLDEKEKVANAQAELKKVFQNKLKSQLHLVQVAQSLTHEQETELANTGNLENLAKGTGGSSTTVGGTTSTDQVVLSEIDYKGVNINIEGRNFRDGYQDLSYPEGLGSNRQDRVRFEQIYSSGRKIAAGINLTDQIFQRSTQRITGSVTLPIVTGIEDTNQVDWQGASLNPLQAVGASGALDIFQKARETRGLGAAFRDAAGATQEAIGRMRQPDSTVGSDINTAINVYLAQKAVGAQGLLSRTTGAILNPNLEMLFNGPSLRQFPFTFKLSARDAEEADQIRKIIRFFKQGMSVKTSSSNVFLKSPNIFRISYQTFNTDGDEIVHPSLNIIKDCALLSCNVQYTPDGTYMTYDDPFRTMTSYQLTLAFGELDPIFDDDYTDLDDNNDQVIGY